MGRNAPSSDHSYRPNSRVRTKSVSTYLVMMLSMTYWLHVSLKIIVWLKLKERTPIFKISLNRYPYSDYHHFQILRRLRPRVPASVIHQRKTCYTAGFMSLLSVSSLILYTNCFNHKAFFKVRTAFLHPQTSPKQRMLRLLLRCVLPPYSLGI